MDSLDSKFTSSLASAATILLRAINNRKYIFALTLKYDYDRLTSYNDKMEIQESKLFMPLLPDARNELLESQNISYGESRMRNLLSSKYVGPIPIYFVQNFMLFQMVAKPIPIKSCWFLLRYSYKKINPGRAFQ